MPIRQTGTDAFLRAVRRMIRRAGERIATEDTDSLRELLVLRDDIDDAIAVAILGLRQEGFTWQSIGEALGVTRQAALMRWSPIIKQLEESEQ